MLSEHVMSGGILIPILHILSIDFLLILFIVLKFVLGLGACEITSNPNDFVAAISFADFGSQVPAKSSPACGTMIEVTAIGGTSPGKSVQVQILDKCEACKPGDVDLGEKAFEAISNLSAGRIAITWKKVGGSGSAPAPPAPPAQPPSQPPSQAPPAPAPAPPAAAPAPPAPSAPSAPSAAPSAASAPSPTSSPASSPPSGNQPSATQSTNSGNPPSAPAETVKNSNTIPPNIAPGFCANPFLPTVFVERQANAKKCRLRTELLQSVNCR
jgi:hypothetical protein